MENGYIDTLSGRLRENLTYMFKESEWHKKLLIGGVLSIIPFLNIITFGYSIEIINNVRQNLHPILPNWSDRFGHFFVDGLYLSIYSIIYSLPLLCSATIITAISGDTDVATAATGSFLVFEFIYLFILAIWMQGVVVNYAMRNEFSAGFEFNRILTIIFNNIPRMLYSMVIIVIGTMILYASIFILMLIPCLGWIAALILSLCGLFYILLVTSYNFGFISRHEKVAILGEYKKPALTKKLQAWEDAEYNITPKQESQVILQESKPKKRKSPSELGDWEDQ